MPAARGSAPQAARPRDRRAGCAPCRAQTACRRPVFATPGDDRLQPSAFSRVAHSRAPRPRQAHAAARAASGLRRANGALRPISRFRPESLVPTGSGAMRFPRRSAALASLAVLVLAVSAGRRSRRRSRSIPSPRQVAECAGSFASRPRSTFLLASRGAAGEARRSSPTALRAPSGLPLPVTAPTGPTARRRPTGAAGPLALGAGYAGRSPRRRRDRARRRPEPPGARPRGLSPRDPPAVGRPSRRRGRRASSTAPTLRQLLPPSIFARAAGSTEWTVPCVHVATRPLPLARAMLDVGRHFMPKAVVLKLIELMALHKLNTLPLASDRRPGLADPDPASTRS